MNTQYDFESLNNDNLVYIRRVTVAGLPDEVRQQAEGQDHVYGVHSPDGACIALVKDRSLAFALARQNDLAPVGVH
ncbi:MAG: DUF1150 family protein [Pseudomonadota bacterium]